MKALLTIVLLLTGLCSAAQDHRSWEPLLAQVLTSDDLDAETWEDTYTLLCELEEQPLDLNTVSREELEQLPFLSARQVEDIMAYLYFYGPMKSLSELRMVKTLDQLQVNLLRCFVYVDEERIESPYPRLSDMLRYGRHELMGNLRVPFYERAGDKSGYQGYPYRHWGRYQLTCRDYVKLGVVFSQDAGEPFLANCNKAGYDFYSYYLQLKHLHRIENLVVGNYKLSAGMGLVLNNSFAMGKLVALQQLGRSTNTVRPHASRSQSGYFRGAAATVSLSQHSQLTVFASYRPQDATLNADGTAATLLADGYHRTQTEIDKKNNTHATDAGARFLYRSGPLHAGATLVYTHFDRELRPNTAILYRRHYAQGNDFMNVSADYGYLHHHLRLNGETAINRAGALATINSLNASVGDQLSLMLLHRFYSYRYTALYARSLSEGGRVQNENGVYLGLTWKPSPHLSLQAYTDYAYFAWARSQASLSSSAWDNLVTAVYSRQTWSLTGRYRLHLKQKDNETKTALDNLSEHRFRLAFSRLELGPLSATTQTDGIVAGSDWGYMLTQTVNARWPALLLNVGGGYFHTTGYDSRLYTYERGPLYSFSFPAYYGEGFRLHLLAQVKLGGSLSLTAKLGYTRYSDRSTIGSGLQQIDGPSQTDLDLQARWKF